MIFGPDLRFLCCVAAGTVFLTACSDFDLALPGRPPPREVAPEPAAGADPTSDPVAGSEALVEPQLSEVPRRPRLTYDLAQEREIQSALVADRDNARHEGQLLRREAGLRQAPPDPNLPVVAPPRQGQTEGHEPPDLTTAYVEEALAEDEDDGSLGDFLDGLERGHAAAVASPAPGEKTASVEDGQEARPVETSSSDAYVEASSLIISFTPGSSVLSAGSQRTLTDFAVGLQRSGRGALVRAEGDPTVLALDRARAVAIRLVQRGVPGNWIDIETAGTGERVVVYASSSDG